ncbi:MAG: hypothetical protein ABEK17_00975 [Candidatus Aenigmatarchaeota archaeon]
MRKGMMYSLEAIIGALIIFSIMLFVIATPYNPPEFKFQTIKDNSYACLRGLDDANNLRALVFNNRTERIENLLSDCMPKTTDYEVQICRKSCTEADLPKNETRVAVSYFISGYNSNFNPTKILLISWGVFD